MKASINRIAILLAVLLPSLAHSQTFPPYLLQHQPLPQGHPKLAQKVDTIAKPQSVQPPQTVYPVCVFDEMNEELKQSSPAFAKALQEYIESAVPLLSTGNADKSVVVEPLLTIPVVVHIVHNGVPIGQGQNLSTAQILAQIDILNEDYAALNSQFYNTPSQWMGIAGFPNIQFCLANKKPDGTATNGIDRQQMTVTGTSWNNNNVNSTIKPAIKWDPTKYFNIYVLPIPGTTAQGGVVGYSNYPLTGQIGSNIDGVVIDYRWFGAPGFTQSGYRPLTHETGHYLGLPHPFNGGSCSLDDGIDDTPNVEVATRDLVTLNCATSYPNGPVSCGNEHLYVNYMDYVTENCYTSFTAGQVNVMRGVLNGTSSGFGYGSRNGLVQNAPQLCSIPATDAGITRVVSPQNVSCTPGQIIPVVTLRNFGTSNLTTANIVYQINNNAPVSKAWQGSLFAGQNLDVSLAPFSPSQGTYTMTVWTTQPNGIADQRVSNDTIIANRFTYLASAPPMYENFENENSFPTSEGIFDLNVSNDEFVWQITTEVSAFGQGGQSVMFDNYNDINGNDPGNTIDALITRHFDFSNVTGGVLKFDVAYAPYIEDIGDSLLVLVATNCTQNFNQTVYKKGGMNLATAPLLGAQFTPTPSQWRTEIVDLSAYNGMSDVTIAIVNKSAFGNRLFIDNIGIGKNCSLLSATATNLVPDDCSATCTGAATILASSPNGGLHYEWEGFPVSFDQATNTGLCGGANHVTVTDAIGCSHEVEFQTGQQTAPQLVASFTDVTIYNGHNGTASVIVSNSSSPYSYAWSNGVVENNSINSTSSITGLAEGEYTVTVTAGNGCTATATISVGSICANFSVSANVVNQPCANASNGTIMALAQNGASPFGYQWSNGMNQASISNLASGNFSVTVTDANGCPSTSSVTLIALPAINLTITPTHQTLQGVNNGSATANASGGGGGFSYHWSNGINANSISGLAPGNYSVTVTDANGCTSTASTTINSVNCGAFTADLSIENLDCFGVNTGSVSATPIGANSPFTYLWSNGATTPTVQNLAAGSISVSVTDAIGCVVEITGTVSSPPQLLANATSTNESMPGANDGSASVSPAGGTLPYSVTWSNGSHALSVNDLVPGIYSVTVLDANGCSVSNSVVVTASTCFIGLQLNSTPTSCPDFADGTASVTIQTGGSGPFTYLWSNGETNASISNLTAQNYNVTVTDAGGCTATGEVDVVSNDLTPPDLVVQTNTVILLDANGAAIIDPNDLLVSATDNCSMVFLTVSPETVDCSDIGQVQVTITATDNSGNESVSNLDILVKDQAPPVITCPSDITLNGCGPVNYASPIATDECSGANGISLELTSGFASGADFPVGTTEVTWKATDESQNASSCSFHVTVNYDLQVSVMATNPSCHGANNGSINLTVSGGQAPYLYNWGGGQGPLPAGNYSVTITDFNGCSIVQTVPLTEPDEIGLQVLNITPATTGQSNGKIEFEISGGTLPYALTWLQAGAPLPNFNPLAAPAGTYQLRVIDANGCLFLSGLITVNSVTGTTENILSRSIIISPNPSSGLFNLGVVGTWSDLRLTVIDGTGRVVVPTEKFSGSSSPWNVDLSEFSNGVYWVKLVAGDAVAIKKIVKI